MLAAARLRPLAVVLALSGAALLPLGAQGGRDRTPPTTPTGLSVTVVSAGTVAANWTASTDNVGVTGYLPLVDGRPAGHTDATSKTLTGLSCGSGHLIQVYAFDAAKNQSGRASASLPSGWCPAVAGTQDPPATTTQAPTTTSAPAPSTTPTTTTTTTATGHQAPPPPPPGSTPSNTRPYVSPTGSDANPCTQAQPCQTFNRAYQVAAPGAVVSVLSGNYPYQRLVKDPAKTSTTRVVFQPAPGAVVSIATLAFGQEQLRIPPPSHVEVRDLRIGYTQVWSGAQDIVLRNLTGAWFDILGGDRVSVLGGTFGPCQAPAQGACTPRLIGTNELVDGATIHGMTSTDLVNYHVDGMFIRGCQGCAVKRTRFYGNMITNIRLQNCCPYPPALRDITLENNWFQAPLEGDGKKPRWDGIDIDDPIPNLLIRNNSFAENTGISFDPENYSGTQTRVVNNLMANIGCAPNVAYDSNLFIPRNSWTGTNACSTTDRKVTSFGYTSDTDFHITASSPAIGFGTRANCPTVDIDNQSRGSRCDAGSDQR